MLPNRESVPNNYFDFVVMTLSLIGTDWMACIKEALRVLTEDGKIVIWETVAKASKILSNTDSLPYIIEKHATQGSFVELILSKHVEVEKIEWMTE